MSAVRHLAVVFAEGYGVARWRARNSDSPVPDDWPYGLQRLADAQTAVQDLECPPLGGVQRLRSAFPGYYRRRMNKARARSGDDLPFTALSWDETVAPRMAANVDARRYYSGIIWMTDQVAAGVGSERLKRDARRALLAMDGLWVLSLPQMALVREWLGPACPPVHYLPFGVDANFYAATPYPQRPKVLSIGGDRDRDPATLFEALDLLLRTRPDVEIVVQSRTQLTPPKGVTLRPFIPHDAVRRHYQTSSVVAVATRPNFHGSGMTVSLEAMASGRPVVASATPGMDDYIIDGVTGHLVEPMNAQAIASAVIDLLSDPDCASQMGANGRARVEQRFTSALMCQALRRIVG